MRGAAPAASGVGDGRIGGAFTDQVADGDCGCGWMAQAPAGMWKSPPLLMWKSPWEWSYTRRSGMVANIPRRGLRVLGLC